MKRIMIAGTHSGCGKTTVTCALLQALVNRGMDTAAFKCGPDYIDPMFHREVIGVPSRNLDAWFSDENTLNFLLQKRSREISVIEGVMGYYDGLGEAASSHALSLATGVPAVIVIDCKGMSLSLGAVMKGFLSFREPNNIVGFIFNRLPESLVSMARELCAGLGTRYFGRLPYKKELSIKSRHLGLVTAGELGDLKEKLQTLAALAEESVLIDELIEAARAPDMPVLPPKIPKISGKPPKIAVARDRAFCFYYEDDLDLLREMGCALEEFSPLGDRELPKDAAGLLLGGGYPELYVDGLAENRSMLSDIREKIGSGLPAIAECGGFMYLNRRLGNRQMAGVIDAEAFKTEGLRRFGYVEIKTPKNSLFGGLSLRAHEFHYWDSTDPGMDCEAARARDGAVVQCAHAGPTLYAGFPHLYLYSCPEAAGNFVKKCQEYENAQIK